MSIYTSQLNAHKTATTRAGRLPSVPMKLLATDGLLNGHMLDYGCGKGCDAEFYGMESFDPHYQPDMPTDRFDVVTCNYVLNVIECPMSRQNVLRNVQNSLADDGIAYVTVRNDRSQLNGITSKGTWQGFIELQLPVLYRCAGFVTYILTRKDTV